MKKLVFVLGVLGLAGCVSPSGDLINNSFSTTQANDSSLSGFWSGNNGPYLVTFKFNGDGTGLMCSSYNGKDILDKLKINGGVIYLQNGLKQTIAEHSPLNLVLKANYFGGATYTYKPDSNLSGASPYCEKALK